MTLVIEKKEAMNFEEIRTREKWEAGGNSTAIFVSGYSEPENLGDEARGQGRDPDCLFKYTSLPPKRLCHCSKITKESARSLSNL